MPTFSDVNESIREYFAQIPSATSPIYHQIGILEAQSKSYLKNTDWAHSAGIYLFFKNNELKYVGRALNSTGLAKRVLNQATAFDDPKWDDVIEDPNSSVYIFTVNREESFWVASLEVFLIQRYRNFLVNKRSG